MRRLTPSLITSYSLRGILGPTTASDDALRPFREARDHKIRIGADIYLMMESDVTPWCKHWAQERSPAVEFMANMTDSQLDQFCAHVTEVMRRQGSQPVAATSFIAEISNKMPDPRPDKFVETFWGKSICTLIRMADRLQAEQPKTVIQIVVGSVIDLFDVEGEAESRRFTVSSRDRDDLTSVTLDRLAACLAKVVSEHGIRSDRIRIAMELEPGPLFLLRDLASLERFASAIERHPSPLVRDCVGFNLDVAHWWLCRDIRPDNDLSESIRSRIFGAHISGHSSRGHLGDWGLDKLEARAQCGGMAKSQRDAYLAWLKFLADENRTPNASNHVSIELEAASPDEDVFASIRTLEEWLTKASG